MEKEKQKEKAMRTVKGSKPRNGVPKIRGLSQTEPRGQGGASWGACAQTRDVPKNTSSIISPFHLWSFHRFLTFISCLMVYCGVRITLFSSFEPKSFTTSLRPLFFATRVMLVTLRAREWDKWLASGPLAWIKR